MIFKIKKGKTNRLYKFVESSNIVPTFKYKYVWAYSVLLIWFLWLWANIIKVDQGDDDTNVITPQRMEKR